MINYFWQLFCFCCLISSHILNMLFKYPIPSYPATLFPLKKGVEVPLKFVHGLQLVPNEAALQQL